mgnify:FL=1
MSRVVSIKANSKTKSNVEKAAEIIFKVCALFALIAVIAMSVYMIISGTPALLKVGVKEILFSNIWSPTTSQFGIAYIVFTSIIGSAGAILIGVPIGLLTAVFLSEVASSWMAKIVKPAVELLAGIPSVVYGIVGILLINPAMYKLEIVLFKNDPTHQFTGGCNLLAAIIILAIMILPTVINISESSLRQVPTHYRAASYALGASRIQTIFKVTIPAAKNGILSAIVLGVGRAIGEAMAIVLVSGNSVNMPLPFNSVRFLTTAIVSEMSYASGLHRQVLFTIGLVLFIFIMIINIVLSKILQSED